MDITISLAPIEPIHDPCAEEQEEPLHTSEVLAHYAELISWIEDQGVFKITRQGVSGTNR